MLNIGKCLIFNIDGFGGIILGKCEWEVNMIGLGFAYLQFRQNMPSRLFLLLSISLAYYILKCNCPAWIFSFCEIVYYCIYSLLLYIMI